MSLVQFTTLLMVPKAQALLEAVRKLWKFLVANLPNYRSIITDKESFTGNRSKKKQSKRRLSEETRKPLIFIKYRSIKSATTVTP